MNRRAAYLDRAPGEVRGVVTLDDEPERLIIRRDGDDFGLAAGARHAARVAGVEPAIGLAFLTLGRDVQAAMPFKPAARPRVGELLEIVIRSEPRRDKLALARPIGPAEGDPRLLGPPPDVAAQLAAWVDGVPPVEGRRARQIADQAEAEVLSPTSPLAGGGEIAIEPTRALVAVDVDLGSRKGPDPKRLTRQANLAAIPLIARLLRLKGLGGLAVIDLVGQGHDGAALMAAARTAFAADNPGVSIGRVGRFGTLEVAVPRRIRPLAEILCDPSGAPSERTLALRLVRRLEDEGRAQPGARLVARAAPAVAAAARPFADRLAETMGARFRIEPDSTFARERFEVDAQ